jgi:hypothetical protein
VPTTSPTARRRSGTTSTAALAKNLPGKDRAWLALCFGSFGKPIEPESCKNCYRGPGTLFAGTRNCRADSMLLEPTRVKGQMRVQQADTLDSSNLNSQRHFGAASASKRRPKCLMHSHLQQNDIKERNGVERAMQPCVGAFQDDGPGGVASEGEGACSALFKVRSHLPLRGKLGWMTPRVGVKTTLTMGRAFRGSCSQARAPFCFAYPVDSPLPHQSPHRRELMADK